MKILETEFRKELYKGLTEAGYTKEEAQKIVGTKYYDALKTDVKDKLGQMNSVVDSESFNNDEIAASLSAINEAFKELSKLKSIIS